MDIDWVEVSESNWGATATDNGPAIATASIRLAGETDGQDQTNAEIWSHYGFSYRPSKPSAGGKCDAIAQHVAGKRIITATRDMRGAVCHGALNEGDVAMWSTGKNTIRCNADGSIALLQQGASTDAGISIEKDGKIILFNQWGQLELGPNGLIVVTKGGSALELADDHFQVLSPQCFVRGGLVALGMAPKPFAGGAAMPPNPSIMF